MMENGLIAKEEDLGLDIFPIYQASCLSFSAPRFDILYGEYMVAAIQKDTELTTDYVKGQISLLEKGYYEPFELGMPSPLSIRKEPELLNYLLANNYSFEMDTIYHNPLKGVW